MKKQQIIRVGSAEGGGEKHERGSGDRAEGEERTKRQSWELKRVTERERRRRKRRRRRRQEGELNSLPWFLDSLLTLL